MENKPQNISYFEQQAQVSRRIIKSLKAKADIKRTLAEKVADWINGAFGSIPFLVSNVIWFIAWIYVNIGGIPGVKPFDPFPFGFLTMVVSLEAIVLSVFVLISQNRAGKIDDLRAETDLQVDMIAEEEITKILELVTRIAEKNNVDLSQDIVLKKMLKPLDKNRIEKALEKQMV